MVQRWGIWDPSPRSQAWEDVSWLHMGCFSRFAGYEAGACKQTEQVVVTLKVLIGAVPTCMILTGLCILMVSPTPQVPSQDTSRRLSLRR